MSAIAFRAEVTAHEDEMSNFAQSVWENISDTVDEKIADDAWDAVSSQVSDAISMDAWDAVSDGVYDAAREAAEEYNNNSDDVESVVSELLRQYNDISVGNHCTIGERATELVTKVIQWHLDTAADEGGLLSPPDVSTQIESASEGLQRVTVLEDKVAQLAEENGVLTNRIDDLTGMVSRLEATTAGLRAKHDTPEATLAHAESTLKHVLIAVQDARGHAVNSGEPF
jgi:predicted RNase H-like nuclease (RuvC/YqgF family)